MCFIDLRSLLLPPCLTFVCALLELGSPADSVFSGRVFSVSVSLVRLQSYRSKQKKLVQFNFRLISGFNFISKITNLFLVSVRFWYHFLKTEIFLVKFGYLLLVWLFQFG